MCMASVNNMNELDKVPVEYADLITMREYVEDITKYFSNSELNSVNHYDFNKNLEKLIWLNKVLKEYV